MRLYHETPHADAILADGFRDGEGKYLTDGMHRGVWVSDRPLGEIGEGGRVFVIDVPEDVVLEFEWVEEGKGYREFLVPAAILNAHDVNLTDDGE